LSGPQKAPLIAAYGPGGYIVGKLSPRGPLPTIASQVVCSYL